MELKEIPYCKRCTAFGNDQETLMQTLTDYINTMDEAIKTDEATYQARLKTCDICPKLIAGLCSYCGCYVLVRAAKKAQKCPHPLQNYWKS